MSWFYMVILYPLPSQISSLWTHANIKQLLLLFLIFVSYDNKWQDEFALIFYTIFARWNNKTNTNKEQKKLDSIINLNNNNKESNEAISVNTTEYSAMNKIALFAPSRNRRKDKIKERKKRLNWLRPKQQELLEQFSNAKKCNSTGRYV